METTLIEDNDLYLDLKENLMRGTTGSRVPSFGVVGKPGTGKVESMLAVAKTTGHEVIYISAAHGDRTNFVSGVWLQPTAKIVIIDEIDRASAEYLDMITSLIMTSMVSGVPVSGLIAVWVVGESIPSELDGVCNDIGEYL